jgi:ABC-type polysaccharide/polyol phosphate export permease
MRDLGSIRRSEPVRFGGGVETMLKWLSKRAIGGFLTTLTSTMVYLGLRRYAHKMWVLIVDHWPNRVDLRLRYAEHLLEYGNLTEAARLLMSIARSSPREVGVYILLARTMARMNFLDHAFAFLARATELQPNAPALKALRRDLERPRARSAGQDEGTNSRSGDFHLLQLRRGITAAVALLRRKRDTVPSGASETKPNLALHSTPSDNWQEQPRPKTNFKVRWFDEIMDFIESVHAVILQTLLVSSKKSLFFAIASPATIIVVALAHSYSFWLLSRSMPAGMSYLGFLLPAFIGWAGFGKALQSAGQAGTRWIGSHKVRWLHRFVASMIWDFAVLMTMVVLLIGFFLLIKERNISYPMQFDSLTSLVSLYFLANTIGFGVKSIFICIEQYFHFTSVVERVIHLVMFLTSGIFESYASLPWQMQQILVFNPMFTINEFMRKAFFKYYFVSDLTIYYPLSVGILSVAGGLLLQRAVLRSAEQ